MDFGAIGGRILDLVFEPLITAGAGLLVAYLVQQLRKVGLEVSEKQEQQIALLARKAVLAVEEQARRQPLNASEKAAIATDILSVEKPKLGPVDLRLAIDAALPEVRAQLEPPKPSTPGTFGK